MQLLHGRVPIELHVLRPATEGQPLLLLHALGESADSWPDAFLDWNRGPVYGLDFAGHGKSGRVRGGAYYPEYFLADADLALEAIGKSCVLVGAGIGAYVAMLLAGTRPDQIPAAWLLEGRGLAGGGSRPEHELPDVVVASDIEGFERFIATTSAAYSSHTDPLVAQCEGDIRPLDYVESFAGAANDLLFSARVGVGGPAVEWWQTATRLNSGETDVPDVGECLTRLSNMASKAG
jgi:pimeloyl-ACP methyl ester carboxylesterase